MSDIANLTSGNMIAYNNDYFDCIIKTSCKECLGQFIIFLRQDDYIKWINGEGFIQDIFNYLAPGERELLLTRTCSDCFDKQVNTYVDKIF